MAVYLFVQMSRDFPYKYVRVAGTVAFLWRLALTTGTGSIFGWLVARPGYDAAIMAPLFIAMSFSFGLAVFILVLVGLFRLSGRQIGKMLMRRHGRPAGRLFGGTVLYFTAVQHLTALYAAEHAGFERFILLEGGLYHMAVLAGAGADRGHPADRPDLPRRPNSRREPILASVLVILGGLAQLYVIVIGGQLYPMELFPGYEVASSFQDGVVSSYSPKWPELLLGLGAWR